MHYIFKSHLLDGPFFIRKLIQNINEFYDHLVINYLHFGFGVDIRKFKAPCRSRYVLFSTSPAIKDF